MTREKAIKGGRMQVSTRMEIEIDHVNLALAVRFSGDDDPRHCKAFAIASHVAKRLEGGHYISEITNPCLKSNGAFFFAFCKSRDDFGGAESMLLKAFKKAKKES